MAFDPLSTSPAHTRAKLATLFGPHSDGRAVQRLYRENKPLYYKYRAEAVEAGLLGESRFMTQEKFDRLPWNRTQPDLTDAEVTARAHYSEQQIRDLYSRSGNAGDKNNLSAIAKDSPEQYRLIRLAAQSYGVIPRDAAAEVRVNEKKTAFEQTPPAADSFVLSDQLCKDLNVPTGYRTNAAGLAHLAELNAQLRAERAAAKEAAAVTAEVK